MDVRYLGSESFVLDYFYSGRDGTTLFFESQSRTEIVYRSNFDTDVTVVLNGIFNEGVDASEGGTITSLQIERIGVPELVIEDISWTVREFFNAIDAVGGSGNFQPLAELFSGGGSINVDGSEVSGGFLFSNAWFNILPLLSEPVNVTGSESEDRLWGTPNDDILNPGGNSASFDRLYLSGGNDTIIFSETVNSSRYVIDFDVLSGPANIQIDGEQNTGTIQYGPYIDTLVNVSSALDHVATETGFSGYLSIVTTAQSDTFELTLSPDQEVAIFGLEGADSYILNVNGATAVLIFTFGLNGDAQQPLIANLVADEILNDGFGNREILEVSETPEVLAIQGTRVGDDVTMGARNEFVELLEGDDIFRLSLGGEDIILGGDGTDTVFLDSNLSSVTLSFEGNETTLIDRGIAGASLEMTSVEILSANDQTLQLSSHDGIGSISADDLTALTELYIAYFNRAADALGLSFWATAFQNNFSLNEIADLFFTQPETEALYSGVTDGAFVQAVYNNVLGRDADQLGFDFWSGQLASGNITESGFILELLAGARAATGDPTDVAYIEAKTDIGVYFAVIQGQSNVAAANNVMNAFDGTSQSVSEAVTLSDAVYSAALASDEELLMQVVGVLDDPFAVV